MTLVLPIAHRWDGAALPAAARAVVLLWHEGPHLRVEVAAPFHDDAPPPGPAGPTPGLWEHEVVEVFVADGDERYLEVELSPHGHHLVLALAGVRNPIRQAMPMRTATRRCGAGLWSGTAWVPRAWLPPRADRANAYRIHGGGEARRHLVHHPLGTDAPDFHRPEAFPRVDLAELPPPDEGVLSGVLAAWLDVDPAAAASLLGSTDPADEPGRRLVLARRRHDDAIA